MLHISSLVRVKTKMNEVHLPTCPFIATDLETHRPQDKNVAGLVTVPCLLVTVTSLPVIVSGLSVSLPSLSDEKVTYSRNQALKVPDWPGKVTDLSGIFTDRMARVTNCTIIFPTQFVCHHVHSG